LVVYYRSLRDRAAYLSEAPIPALIADHSAQAVHPQP